MNQNGEVRLTISYGVKQEIQRVKNTLKKLQWYLEQGYRIQLPEDITKESSDEDVMKSVQRGYVEADYAENEKRLQEEWRIVSRGFEEMRREPSFHLQNEYGVMLTKYGVGGSYDVSSSQVIVKIKADAQISRVETVAHEIVHMTIQYLIDLYQVRHWRKERLVDLIMERYFPELTKMQAIKEDVSMVNRAFEKHFPDIEAIAQAVGG